MTQHPPTWLTGALVLMALGPGSARRRHGRGVSVLQLAQLAPNGAPGIVTTVALGDLPDGQPIAVTPFADDDLSLSVKARFEAALRVAGRPVSDSAALTLSFDSRMIEGRFTRAEANMGLFEANDEGVRLNLNI